MVNANVAESNTIHFGIPVASDRACDGNSTRYLCPGVMHTFRIIFELQVSCAKISVENPQHQLH